MPKKYIPQYLTEQGKFDEASANVDRAQERQRRGMVGFTRNDQFAKVMSSSDAASMAAARQRGNQARADAADQSFSDQYDSKLGAGRKKAGGGKMGRFGQ